MPSDPRQVLPYGAWPSPISALDVARAGRPPDWPDLVDGALWWTQVRPQEDGRTAVVRAEAGGAVVDVLPAPWSAHSRVHEYGGRSWLAAPSDGSRDGGPVLVFAEQGDQRLYRLDPGADTPVALTPAPPAPAALRYADLVPGPVRDGTPTVWCVREAHGPDGIRRHLVEVPVDGSGAVREVVGGSDFLAWPRLSADGARLAWVAWGHPAMPWTQTVLRVADLGADGVATGVRDVLGGPGESVLQPEWADADTLYAITDATGWWNLVRIAAAGGSPTPLCPRAEEFGGPLWELGYRWYRVLDDGRLACLVGTDTTRLALLDPGTGALTDVDTGGLTAWSPTLVTDGAVLADVAGSPAHAWTPVVVDPVTARLDTPAGTAPGPDPRYLPEAYAIDVPSAGGRTVHANVYPPRNPVAAGPDGTAPPCLVIAHGGPTSQSPLVLSTAVAYWTSRGIAVLDVNYGGSTGYGRAYRELLDEQWGVVDVEDVVAAARGLGDRGGADTDRLLIRGGSAGGWTVLSVLTRTDAFAAGTSYYGVAELKRFAEDTHDFESRYLDHLIGRLPDHRGRYVERAPLTNVDGLSCPVLLLQGADDEVVPPSQAELFRDALRRKGIPHAYLLFAGEEHGFRRAETTVAALEAELSFYGQVLGFDPPGVPRLELERPVPAG